LNLREIDGAGILGVLAPRCNEDTSLLNAVMDSKRLLCFVALNPNNYGLLGFLCSTALEKVTMV
jgi:hypothetical protein